MKSVLITFCLLFLFWGNSYGQPACCKCRSEPSAGGDGTVQCTPNMDPCISSTCTHSHCQLVFGPTYRAFACDAANPDCSGSGCANILPVELTKFETQFTDEGVSIHWATASESNNQGFEIQRSSDGRYWIKLEFIDGNGTRAEEEEYDYLDKEPSIGLNYYRLKQMDYDGSFEYSPVRVIVWQGKAQNKQLVIMPNPVFNRAIIVLPPTLSKFEELEFEFFDMLGRLVYSEKKQLNTEIEFDLSTVLKKGLYIIKVQKNGLTYNSRLFKM